MTLSDKVQALSSRTIASLKESHDYYTYTKRAWRLLQQIVKEGRTFTFRNVTTGTSVDEQTIHKHSQLYIDDYLIASTFQHFVSIFEDYFFQVLRLWLTEYPGSLSKKHIEVGTVLKSPDKASILVAIVDKELNEIKYERPAEWFLYLGKLISSNTIPKSGIDKIAEIKATRDILIHNNGIANAIYTNKAGAKARFKDGDKIDISEQYHLESWKAIHEMVQIIASAIILKLDKNKS